mmetsp:Transcript_37883/g.109198  ORF Transcript_37883/g.109198 Transcript_37883/m.109198 type:complete len:505 (-) Transcript_37883:60-1574(-)
MAASASSSDGPRLEPGEIPPGGPSYGSMDQSLSSQLESLEAGSPRPIRRSVSDLPDLTERLKEAGIYGEYHAYRLRYLQWRKGSAQGAVGELTANALTETNDPYKFEFWYPTASIFKWRFTTAYWIAILYLLGSFLFTFSNGFLFFHGPGDGTLVNWLNSVGAVCFTVAAYFQYCLLINVTTTKEEQVTYLIPDCLELSERAVASSILGTASYFVGAVLFNLGAFNMFYPFERSSFKASCIALPNFLGAIGFVIGGICEVIHNRLFRGGATPYDLVFWATICNFIGDWLFFLGAVPDLFFAETSHPLLKENWIAWTFGIGSLMFIFSSILMLAMWRANDFGLTLIKQLNFAIRSTGCVGLARQRGPKEHIGVRIYDLPEDADMSGEKEEGLSARGAMFIVIYTWFAFTAIVNCCCKHIWYAGQGQPHLLQHFIDLGMQVFVLCVIGLVLVIHSVVTEVPDEQPFNFALVASRFVLLVGAIFQTSIMVTFLIAPLESRHPSLFGT